MDSHWLPAPVITVQSIAELRAVVFEPGSTDMVFVTAADAFFRHAGSGEAAVDDVNVIPAADGGIWRKSDA